MQRIYRATLHENRVSWIDDPPTLNAPTLVEITFLVDETEAERRERGRRAAEALREIAHIGGAFSRIEDPVAWQREIRRDRLLPGH